MFDYSTLERLVYANVKDGHSISRPVPRVADGGRRLDCVYVYGADARTGRPLGAPSVVVGVDYEARACENLDVESLFSGIAFDARNYVPPSDYVRHLDEAEEAYGSAREEVFCGAPAAAARRYARALAAMTPACLMPYYRALAPGLFAGCERG